MTEPMVESESKRDPLDDIPELDTNSDDWVTAQTLATLPGKNGKCVAVGTLKNKRGKADETKEENRGIDPDRRMWRRDPNNRNLIWYYLPSCPEGKPATPTL